MLNKHPLSLKSRATAFTKWEYVILACGRTITACTADLRLPFCQPPPLPYKPNRSRRPVRFWGRYVRFWLQWRAYPRERRRRYTLL